jgi:hypothetical protein
LPTSAIWQFYSFNFARTSLIALSQNQPLPAFTMLWLTCCLRRFILRPIASYVYLGSAEKVKPPQEPFYRRATKKFQVRNPHGVQKNQTTMLKKYEK